MARTPASRTPLRSYVTVFESEGARWGESYRAVTLLDAELLASTEAQARGLRVISTLPLDPEA